MGNTRVGRHGILNLGPATNGSSAGTWVPLREGKLLAERNGVLEKLRPIFDFVQGDSSPPPAPKHTTNSNKPKLPKAPSNKKIPSECRTPLATSASC